MIWLILSHQIKNLVYLAIPLWFGITTSIKSSSITKFIEISCALFYFKVFFRFWIWFTESIATSNFLYEYRSYYNPLANLIFSTVIQKVYNSDLYIWNLNLFDIYTPYFSYLTTMQDNILGKQLWLSFLLFLLILWLLFVKWF